MSTNPSGLCIITTGPDQLLGPVLKITVTLLKMEHYQYRPGTFLGLLLIAVVWFANPAFSSAQGGKRYWQHEVQYKMELDLDVRTNRMTGKQRITFKNNSPDVLDRAFFHLYFNAFQPGSVMDVRSQYLPDPDPRVGDRISKLAPDEIGFMEVKSLLQNGKPAVIEHNGTILEVWLAEPIKPGQKAKFDLEFDAQVPVQIRRNGRDNREGIRYSMAQAYPKLCQHDEQGWHAHPYIGREFYGIWGDFEVEITIDKEYTVAASGELKNAKSIGHGYAPDPRSTPDKLTWKFEANDVHDFVWAADPDYIHDVHTCRNGVVIHTFYEDHETYTENWEALPAIMEEVFNYLNEHYGEYPYPVYSFIQGGDGGMEYPMATLITGHRSLGSLVGVSIHELVHSWYQMVLGLNESYYYWMDEGFTNYVSELAFEHLKTKGLLIGDPDPNPFVSFYRGYENMVKKGLEEPMSTHADFFESNTGHVITAYSKGAVFLHQLQYVIGKPAFDQGMLDFFHQWKFKHPDVNDFIRVMEKASGLELDWYKELMVYSLKTIDYSVDTVMAGNNQSSIQLERLGLFPMPVDVTVKLKSGESWYYSIPLDIMRGAKNEKAPDQKSYHVLPDWPWVNMTYAFNVPYDISAIESVQIDGSDRLADFESDNDQWTPAGMEPKEN